MSKNIVTPVMRFAVDQYKINIITGKPGAEGHEIA
jgi:hypothetical protein